MGLPQQWNLVTHEIEFAGDSKWEISEDFKGGKLHVEVMIFLFCFLWWFRD